MTRELTQKEEAELDKIYQDSFDTLKSEWDSASARVINGNNEIYKGSKPENDLVNAIITHYSQKIGAIFGTENYESAEAMFKKSTASIHFYIYDQVWMGLN